MTRRVWISGIKSDSTLGDRLGSRCKHFGQGWSAARHEQAVASRDYLARINRNGQGHALERRCFPEAVAVWDRACFARACDFFWVDGFAAVKGKLAEVLSGFDFGAGGLIPLTMLGEDLTTPEPGTAFMVNFGERKDTLDVEASRALWPFYVEPATGRQIWKSSSHTDGDIAVTSAALVGADVWSEERISSSLLFSDPAVTALRQADISMDFRLAECRVT